MQMKKVIGMSSSKFMGCSVVVGFGSKGYGGGGGGCRDRAQGALLRGCGGLAGPRRLAREDLFGRRGLADQVALRVLHAHLLRSEEHTSEIQSLMRNSYAVFCLKKQKTSNNTKR